MKILFICRANVGRSQMAEAIYNEKTNSNDATSAGLAKTGWTGKKLSETKYVSPVLKELNINADNQISKVLNKEMAESADRIIVIGEKQNWPEYLQKSDKVNYWDIADPDGGDMNVHRQTRNEISRRVDKIIEGSNV